jgi:NADH-ubiquinone oxidoreductase chain 4
MLLSGLAILPIITAIYIASIKIYNEKDVFNTNIFIKNIALFSSVGNFCLSLIIYIMFNSSTNQFQYIQEHHNVQIFDVYLGVDGISIYFILLTTFIMPFALLSN